MTVPLRPLGEDWEAIAPSYAEAVPQAVERLIQGVIAGGCSDLHLVPAAEGLELLARREGVLQRLGRWPRPLAANVVARIKVLADLLTYRVDTPQEGRMRQSPAGIEIRVASFPTVHGEKVVLRLFVGSGKFRELEDLGFEPSLQEELDALLTETSGVLTICGPAGSGKTTTAYACLRAILDQELAARSIVTLEDPVEALLPGAAQSQINAVAGFTYEHGLKSLLRQDPDVILVGEIRDSGTAVTAFQAALTGHLVLTTFHAGSAAEGLTRLVDLGIEPFVLRSALLAATCQRLLRRFCGCAEWSTARDDCGGLSFEKVRRPVGCSACHGSGYDGRLALMELLDPNRHKLGRLLLQAVDAETLSAAAEASGYRTLLHWGEHAIAQGVTGPTELYRVLGRRRIAPSR